MSQRDRQHHGTHHGHRPLSEFDIYSFTHEPMIRWADVQGGGALAGMLAINPDDDELREVFDLTYHEQMRKAMEANDPFWPNYPPPGGLMQPGPGDIPLAALPTGDILSIHISALLRNVLLVGPTGGGKTNALRLLIAALLENC